MAPLICEEGAAPARGPSASRRSGGETTDGPQADQRSAPVRARSRASFFAAHAQSSLGTGAGYVALLVLAYERLESPWAISLVLLADFLPAMFLGPIFGAAADRWSRRWCAASADVARALAFVSLAFFDGFAVTVALALAGRRRHGPVQAGRDGGAAEPRVAPRGFRRPRRSTARSLTSGSRSDPRSPALGLLLAERRDRDARERDQLRRVGRRAHARARSAAAIAGRGRASLVREARAGVRAVARMPGLRAVIAGSSAVVLFAGLFNVGELLLAEDELGGGDAGFALLVAIFGLGVVAGSLAGARTVEPRVLKRRYLAGLGVTGVGFLARRGGAGRSRSRPSGSRWPGSATGSSWCTSGSSCR